MAYKALLPFLPFSVQSAVSLLICNESSEFQLNQRNIREMVCELLWHGYGFPLILELTSLTTFAVSSNYSISNSYLQGLLVIYNFIQSDLILSIIYCYLFDDIYFWIVIYCWERGIEKSMDVTTKCCLFVCIWVHKSIIDDDIGISRLTENAEW